MSEAPQKAEPQKPAEQQFSATQIESGIVSTLQFARARVANDIARLNMLKEFDSKAYHNRLDALKAATDAQLGAWDLHARYTRIEQVQAVQAVAAQQGVNEIQAVAEAVKPALAIVPPAEPTPPGSDPQPPAA